MLFLNISNRTENLLLQLATLLDVDPQPSPFDGELFLIQSRGMERLIAQRMADSFSCFAHFQFFLPLNCISYFAEKVGLSITPDGFDKDVLIWRLEGLLRDIAGDVYEPLRHYLSGDNAERKRLQLARRLADLLDQYQIMRPDMLAQWEEGKTLTDQPAELWQKALWCRLIENTGSMHRGSLLVSLTQRLNGQREIAAMPKRLLVFGVHSMPPIFLRFLGALANHIDVHLYLLSPCRQFWGDFPVGKKQLLKIENEGGVLNELIPHPLLVSLGRQGRDFQNMLLTDVTIGAEFASYDEPLSPEDYRNADLLGRVRSDLLEGRLPEAQLPVRDKDHSVTILSCHSKLRELQVLRDHILFLLESNRELTLRDIVVMAPNIQEYSGLIPAVFNDIQHTIADRSMRGGNRHISAFMVFLSLLRGRFGWSEVVDFLRLPVVYPAFGLTESELEQAESWILESGIRWGLSGKQREDAGLTAFEDASWKAGLDRLLMGLAVDTGEFVNGVLPYQNIEGKSGIALGAVCRLYDLLLEAVAETTISRGLETWGVTLLDWIERLWPEDSSQDVAELRSVLVEMSEKISSFHDHPLSFEVLYDWLKNVVDQTRSSSGFLRGQLMFCSMLPMRSIPFEAVCLLGLNDGVFPKSDRRDTFDLMAASFVPGDRSPRSDDRYQFLEAIVAARSHLVLSYAGQSVKTDEKIPPSVVVTEFIEFLDRYYSAGNLIVEQPLHSFSDKYFREDGDPRVFTYDDYGYRTAMALTEKRTGEPPWWSGSLADLPGNIAVHDLLRFFENPPKFFVVNCLGVRLTAGWQTPEDRELFDLTGLDRYWAEEVMLDRALSGNPLGAEEARARGLWPLGSSGELSFSAKQREIQQLVDKIQTLEMGERQPDEPVDLEDVAGGISGSLSNVFTEGILIVRNGELRGRDILVAWLHHLLLARLRSNPVTKVACRNEFIEFSAIPESAGLDVLRRYYERGCLSPLRIFPDPARLYVEQTNKPKARKSPLQAAEESYSRSLVNGYEPEWSLLFGSMENVLDSDEFTGFCSDVMLPILSSCRRVSW